jgi:hypothetical protein
LESSEEKSCEERLFKIWSAYEYFLQKFVCLQPKEMVLDEATIPWWGGLKFGTCNPQKTTKYGVMV